MNDTTSTVATTAIAPPAIQGETSTSAEPATATTGSNQDARPKIDVSKLPKIRRRSYMIDRGRQIRTAMLTSGLAAILLLIVNTAFTILRNSQTTAISSAAPQLESSLSQQDARVGTMLILVSIIFVIGVFILTIAETHRTAGAVLATYRSLEKVADGDFLTPLRLRPKDNLRDLRGPFNEMISSLRKQALADADALDSLAKAATAADVDTAALAEALGDLAVKKRELGGDTKEV
jgi:methyl-accepting chemotaxis protein